MSPVPVALTLDVQIPGNADDVERERTTHHLGSELSALDLQQLSTVAASNVQKGAKAGAVTELGQLALVILPAVLPKLIDFLQAWCLRNRDRSVIIKIEGMQLEFPPGGLPKPELEAILDKLGNHTSPDDASTAPKKSH